jgi:hypothetical protein
VKGEFIMAVEAVGEKYRCNICGNEALVTAEDVARLSVAARIWRKSIRKP